MKKSKRLYFNEVREFNFREGKYKIYYKAPKNRKFGGLCFPPKSKGKISKIYIDPKMNEKDFLRICIDETIHANFWCLDNDEVGIASASISKFLWKLGFRLRK